MNRILRFIPEGAPGGECIEYEADPRHADILAAQFGFTDTSKTVATPGVRTKMTESQLEPLKDKDAAFYRSACMRLGYLSMDRPELQYVAKECARGMAVPTEGHYEVLKRAARFVHGHRRMVWRFPRQPERSFLDGFSDSDWAGCLRTRKSTSSSAFRYGQHLISTSSTTQVPISFSSGEAEFYSIVKTASRLIGLQQLEGPGQAGHEGQAVDRRCGSQGDGLATRSWRRPPPRDPDSLGAEGDQGQEVHPAQGEGRGQHRRPGDEARRDPDDVEAPQQDGALRRSRPQQAGTEGRPLRGHRVPQRVAPRGPVAGSAADAVAGCTALATPSGQHRYYSSGQHRTSLEAGSTASYGCGPHRTSERAAPHQRAGSTATLAGSTATAAGSTRQRGAPH